jgi:ferredoxin-type protein NapG
MFFGQALRRGLGPVVRVVEGRWASVLRHLAPEPAEGTSQDGSARGEAGTGPLDQLHVARSRVPQVSAPRGAISLPIRYLRPPGAAPVGGRPGAADGLAPRFEDLCTQCGKCVEACPAHAIQADATGRLADGLPYIVALDMPCVVCDSLACMTVCPEGALVPVARTQIRMGVAKVDHARCLRHLPPTYARVAAGKAAEPCRVCVDICPLGEAAILISPRSGKVIVRLPGAVAAAASGVEVAEGCIGCGLCEQHCPAPRTETEGRPAIWVVPTRRAGSSGAPDQRGPIVA